MSNKRYFIKPLSHIYHMEDAPFNAHFLSGQWPCKNVRVSSNRIDRRWDLLTYRTFDDTETIQWGPIFRKQDGTYTVLVLTAGDLCEVKTGSSETFKYLTETITTGTIASITGTAVEGTSTTFTTDGVAAGDQFIITADHTANQEGPSTGTPAGADNPWATVASVTDQDTLTLSANYTGDGTSGAYKIRKVHTTPDNERWGYAVVNGKFCFFNGDVAAQYWNGSDTYATTLNSTYADRARYGIAFANRLLLADVYVSATRNPWRLITSDEGDPTKFYGDTGITDAANYDFFDTEEPITGLGVASGQLVVFKKTMYHIGQKTGIPVDPLVFNRNYRGVGLYAPYSLVHYGSTIAWLGIDDFYTLNGEHHVSIGAPIRRKFFSIIPDDDLRNVFGINNIRFNEIVWVANTTAGQYVFSWNYKENSWTQYEFDSNVTGLGGVGF